MKNLLYVDDDIINLAVFEVQFQDQFNVITCNNPLHVENSIKSEDIPIMVTDYRMPEMNGMDLIRKVKEWSPDTICIILSGFNKKELKLDSHLIFDFVLKPFDFNHLQDTIHRGLASKEAAIRN